MGDLPAYDPEPTYPLAATAVVRGWEAAVADLPPEMHVLAVDGSGCLDWAAVFRGIEAALNAVGRRVATIDIREWMQPWDDVLALTSSPELSADPDFARLPRVGLAQLFRALPPPPEAPPGGVGLVLGPGAALVEHDRLWYVDLPKRYAEAAVVAGSAVNLGQPLQAGPGTTRRLFYLDWPMLDRHRDAVAPGIDRWLDLQDPAGPVSVDGPALRTGLAELARRPFRTRPTFNTTSWGGHWAQRELGMNTTSENTALGYELIAPESGILLGDAANRVEVPFALLVATHPHEVLGDAVQEMFGASFPVRFDYLDTMAGGNLSIHCHPQSDYMRDVFGWPYPQHESYYIMVGGPDNEVYLGLREDIDLEKFHRQAHEAQHNGRPFEITDHVQSFPATPHQLFLVPVGTPHGSGEGNVVLEVSATPYLYSLRFYDWLRRDSGGSPRPVHVEHAFANLNPKRRGDAVRSELVPRPAPLREGPGWWEEVLGSLEEMFYEVRRVTVEAGSCAPDDTNDRFHVATVVSGPGAQITSNAGSFRLAYAETVVVPAALGKYEIEPLGPSGVRLVKAVVR